MLHRNTLIAICAIFCAIAVGAGLFVANLSKQSGLIAQQPGIVATSPPTAVAGAEPTPLADLPTVASQPVPTSAPIAVLDPAEPSATSQPAPTSAPTAAPTAAPINDAPAYSE